MIVVYITAKLDIFPDFRKICRKKSPSQNYVIPKRDFSEGGGTRKEALRRWWKMVHET